MSELARLIEQFHAAAIPKEEWTHLAHLRVGAWYVAREGWAAALPLLRAGIRRLNEAHGTINSETSGYHETITAAYARLIDDFLSQGAGDGPLEAQVAALLASPLADRQVLLRHYTRGRLMASDARLGWVEPDLEPLP
jgi:hypothetical protein